MCSGRRQAQGCIWPWLWHRVGALLPEGWALEPQRGCRVQEKSHQQGKAVPPRAALATRLRHLIPLLLGRLANIPFMGFRPWICREQLLQRARRCSHEYKRERRQSWAATGARLSLCSEKATVHEQCVHAMLPAGEYEVKGKSWFDRTLHAVV